MLNQRIQSRLSSSSPFFSLRVEQHQYSTMASKKSYMSHSQAICSQSCGKKNLCVCLLIFPSHICLTSTPPSISMKTYAEVDEGNNVHDEMIEWQRKTEYQYERFSLESASIENTSVSNTNTSLLKIFCFC